MRLVLALPSREDEGDGLVEQGFVAVAGAGNAERGAVAAVIAVAAGFVGPFGDLVVIGRVCLAAEELDDLLDLVVGDEGAVDAGDATAAGHVQEVAHAEKLFGALLAQDGAAVELADDLEGDPGGEVGLDGARDHVDGGALGGHDDVDAGGTGHLGEALDGGFDFLAGDHHEVGHLVDDDGRCRAEG